jgi:hypothetical protein
MKGIEPIHYVGGHLRFEHFHVCEDTLLYREQHALHDLCSNQSRDLL